MTSKWPQTGLRVAAAGHWSWWIYRRPTLGRSVVWRVTIYRREVVAKERKFRSLKSARAYCEQSAEINRAQMKLFQ